MELEDLTSLNNQVLLMIAEYHLMSTSQGTHCITPILPEGAARLVPPISEYLPREFQGPHNMRVTDQVNTLCVATWLHHLDLTANYGRAVSESPDVGQYNVGPLLEYFLMLRTSSLTFKEVTQRVSQENHQVAESSLWELHEQREELRQQIELLAQTQDQELNKEAKKPLKKRLNLRRRELRAVEDHLSEQELLLGLWGS